MSGTSIGNATSLAGTSLQATDVIPVERPGVTTPYKTKVSSLAALATGAIDIRDYGAVGDGVTDDTAAIQNAINAASGTGYAVFIPPTSAFWNVTYAIRVPSNVTIFGVGERSHLKQTATSAPSWWPGEAWFARRMFYVGSFPGEGETTALPYSPYYHLTWYGIANSPAGTTRITFDTNADADKFTVDDVVFLKSGVTFTTQITGGNFDDPFDRPLYVQVNIVRAVGDGYVDLVYPLNHDFDASSSIATEAEPYVGQTGENIYYARNVTMRDLYLEMASGDSAYAIYASGINLLFENILIEHDGRAFGANGFVNSTVRNMIIRRLGTPVAGKYPLDIAHMSHNSLISGLYMDYGEINIGEAGSFITLENFYLGYGLIVTPGKHYLTIRNGKIARFDGTLSASLTNAISAGNPECEGHIVENVTIDGLSDVKYGIAVHGIGTIVRNCNIIASTETNAYGLAIHENAVNYLIEGNVIGKHGSYGVNDRIHPFGTSYLYGVMRNNLTRTTIYPQSINALASANTAATPVTLRTLSFLANQFRYGNMVRIVAAGWVSGTNDTKVITLHNSAVTGNPAMATISLTAGETGAWKIEAILNSGGATVSSGVRCHVICYGPGEAIEQHQEYQATGDLTADWAITLVGEVANASDAIYCQHWMVEPLQDQYATA